MSTLFADSGKILNGLKCNMRPSVELVNNGTFLYIFAYCTLRCLVLKQPDPQIEV